MRKLKGLMIGLGLYALCVGLLFTQDMREWYNALIAIILLLSSVFFLPLPFFVKESSLMLKKVILFWSIVLLIIFSVISAFFIFTAIMPSTGTFPSPLGWIIFAFVSPLVFLPLLIINEIKPIKRKLVV